MKKYFAALLAVLMFGCCRPPAPEAATYHTTSGEATVRHWRELDMEMHIDVECPDRQEIVKATDAWRAATDGHVRFKPMFDLDFSSIGSLVSHRNDAMILCVTSNFAGPIDARHRGSRILAETSWVNDRSDGAVRIHVIIDRVKPNRYAALVMHELGHVLGMPDMDSSGSVMSGTELPSDPVGIVFTEDDRSLCRLHRFCM